MTVVITILADDNARNRRRARRADEREKALQSVKRSAKGSEKALSLLGLRQPKEEEFVTRESQKYRKVRNPLGQQVNARQKMRGKSIPLI